MASAYSPVWMRFLHKVAPCLFRVCIGGNWHWRWSRYCYCCCGEHFGTHHGGMLDMKTGQEWIRYEDAARWAGWDQPDVSRHVNDHTGYVCAKCNGSIAFGNVGEAAMDGILCKKCVASRFETKTTGGE